MCCVVFSNKNKHFYGFVFFNLDILKIITKFIMVNSDLDFFHAKPPEQRHHKILIIKLKLVAPFMDVCAIKHTERAIKIIALPSKLILL